MSFETSDSLVLQVVLDQSRRVLETYRVDPGLIQEHANSERRITQGGYGERQLYELVQNGADELRDDPGGDIQVVLTDTHLYCANMGNPVTPAGAETILRMSVSRKRGGQIGRFGVGVKSVLSVSDTPQFFSVSGSFGFDKEWSAEQIRAVYSNALETPVLRTAKPLDLNQTVAVDPVLAELMKWASTVVRLPLKPEAVNRLGEDIKNFPKEFGLFSAHVGAVILEDRRTGRRVQRKIFHNFSGKKCTVQEENANGKDVTEKWQVFTRTHAPSSTALGAAGELHDRPEIDISWAVPDQRRAERGTFWAYFPTNYDTTLKGILNAPWKTSEDRQNLFDHNAFNDELLTVAADLVVDSIPELSSSEDPGSYLDFLPARGREASQWADRRLTAAVWGATATKPSLPDQRGEFRTPKEIRLHPEGLREEWLQLWAEHRGAPRNWCHRSVEQRDRRARVGYILAAANVSVASLREWLEALVADGSAEASIRAVRIVAGIKRDEPKLAEEALRAKIVLTESHGLVAPVEGRVFRRSTTDALHDDLVYVAEQVARDTHALQALGALGIHEADGAGRFAAVVAQGFHGYGESQWADFWQSARRVDPTRAVTLLREKVADPARTLRVRTMSGHFRLIHDCLLPGVVVPGDGSRDQEIAVDMGFHADDRVVFPDLGLTETPLINQDPRGDSWYDEYEESAWKTYCATLPTNASRPRQTSMKLEGANPAGPLHLLLKLSEEGRAAFLQHLPDRGVVRSWTIQVGAHQSTRRTINSPLVWAIRKYGRVKTSRGIMPVHASVGSGLSSYQELLPVARISTSLATALNLPAALGDVSARIWERLAREAARSEDDEFPGQVYALVLEAAVDWPEGVPTRCRIGDTWTTRPDAEIAVTAIRSEYEDLKRELVPALLVPNAQVVESLVETWGMRRVADVIAKEIRYVPQSDPTLLTDEFPHLKVNYRQKVTGWSIVRCSELEEITRTPHGMRAETVPSAAQDRSVLILNPEDDLAALVQVDRTLKLGLGAAGCASILARRQQQRDHERVQRARKAVSPVEKILELVGEEQLKRGLPEGLLESEQTETGKVIDAQRVAQLAINAHGAGILRHHSKDLAARIPEAPSSFRGDTVSRRFISELGLPEAYAGAKTVSRPPEEEVDGPTSFPRLHAYQEQLADNMFRLLTRPAPGRAMLSLPTGAGKTRVAAEGVIRVIKERGLTGPVLWIAPTEELCEQAVQSWRFVWSKVGPDKKLTISRLWSSNAASAVQDNAHLVVATDAKLAQCLDGEEYAWLRRAAVVIVDEAHTSTSPRYTQILRSLGLTFSRTERPLIGLTATPYRSNNEEETKRLVDRFGRARLDDGVFPGDPYTALQEFEMLARVDHRELPGATISLDAEELRIADFRGLPASAEQRLAGNEERTRMLIDEIVGLPKDWPILVFATSVNHAKVLAAKLNGRNVTAAAIDAATPISERRSRIDDFRSGRIRVLTNFGVLHQGFDAPATRAVVVARPTYSPNVYQQMIGRGLRGPKNGGKERCLILDVRDNIVNFDESLAFTQFEHLWSNGE
ncbi:DEAD/DEAH box helicase [Streptosporangium amethystogenes subsp. fukuiense]|uniref:DEAD/DEAH box helicase n=1 Tax=Streptosporangium amethystogenes subsp. fukuiense TaxID=698418 RepID=A0ABW2TAL1_9ACTN